MPNTEIAPLANLLRRASEKQVPVGAWIYLPTGPLSPDIDALLIDSCEDEEALAESLGFPVEGLSSYEIEEIVEVARQLASKPSDEQLLEAFTYFLKFDAFLPAFGAGPPLPRDDVLARLDRDFIQSLGPERPGTPCRAEGCGHGAIALSVLCARHHFESVRGRPFPS